MVKCFQENCFDILFLQDIMVNYMLTWEENLHDKRDDFNVPIVNFPFICSNIPAAPAYGGYISQLIRYSRACSSYWLN